MKVDFLMSKKKSKKLYICFSKTISFEKIKLKITTFA
jgi:hypothetical protein